MSYILDALKKTEAAQDPVAAATIALSQQRTQSRNRVIGIVVALALLANAAVLAWLFGPKSATAPPLTAVTPAVPTPTAATPMPRTEARTHNQTVDQTLNQTPDQIEARAAVAAEPPAAPPLAAREQRPVAAGTHRAAQPAVPDSARPPERITARLSELPPTVRERFPGLVFSSHIFAEDPSLRAVVANGSRLVVGDAIGGARVEDITEEGVIVAFEDYLVDISVVADWQ